jgi:hypothetical protein
MAAALRTRRAFKARLQLADRGVSFNSSSPLSKRWVTRGVGIAMDVFARTVIHGCVIKEPFGGLLVHTGVFGHEDRALGKVLLQRTPDAREVLSVLWAERTSTASLHQGEHGIARKANRGAIKRWHTMDRGWVLAWPDHADQCIWLLEQLKWATDELGEAIVPAAPPSVSFLVRQVI